MTIRSNLIFIEEWSTGSPHRHRSEIEKNITEALSLGEVLILIGQERERVLLHLNCYLNKTTDTITKPYLLSESLTSQANQINLCQQLVHIHSQLTVNRVTSGGAPP